MMRDTHRVVWFGNISKQSQRVIYPFLRSSTLPKYLHFRNIWRECVEST
ncbi:MAG: hypothetical protein PWP74_1698 [Shewanella sp.]|nr:hypothetical protein [Shewanella sp.]